MDTVFLDANVLFSAAYRPDAGLKRLWKLEATRLVTSAYAVAEARRNLEDPSQFFELDRLLLALDVAAQVPSVQMSELAIPLPAKDLPIFMAALHMQASHLLTGDVKHFGPYFGKRVAGTLILPPARYLAFRSS